MNKITYQNLSGDDLLQYLPALARLRIEVFHAFPYLYDGTMEYEQQYLQTYASAPESVIVDAFDGSNIVGAATATVLIREPDYITNAFINYGMDPAEFFYYGESVLQKNYRNRGIGVRFFEERKKHDVLAQGFRMMLCYCGSAKRYAECCAIFHRGKKIAQTAEQLMRSRYAAFCTKNADYLIATHHPAKRRRDDNAELQRNFAALQWLGLVIVTVQQGQVGDTHGIVEFEARFLQNGVPGSLREASRFVKEDGRGITWKAISGLNLECLEVLN